MKSREDLVMSSTTPEADPFGAAPFDPNKVKRHRLKELEKIRIQAEQIHLDKTQDFNSFNILTSNASSLNHVSQANQGMKTFDFWN